MSAIDFSRLQAPTNGPARGGNNANDEQPKANFWMNIGYSSTFTVGEGKEAVEETRFISLPGGIPLDSLKPVATNSSNEVYAAQQAARNDLYEQVMEIANSLQPGEETMVKLQVQVRRVAEERATIDPSQNIFVQARPKLI
jgi:hypothetical protein